MRRRGDLEVLEVEGLLAEVVEVDLSSLPAVLEVSASTGGTEVLVDGKSFHGGNLAWSLPTQDADGTWQPGAWHEVELPIAACSRGLHVTERPGAWWHDRAVAYVVECAGESSGDAHKRAWQRVRLTRPATAAELAAHGIITEGEHRFGDGAVVLASGSASVTASGSASVTAYDSASVTASGSASVRAYDSASVTASGSARVWAYDSARVWAYDSASVTAYGSARVWANNHSTVTQVQGAPTVKLADDAVRIDRRGERVRCYRAKRRAT